MIATHSLFRVACIGCILTTSAGTGWAGPPEGLAAFVQSAAADLSSSPLQIPQFKSAVPDTVEDLGKANGLDRYLCWLKSDQGRMGYIAVADRGNSYAVLAFSATAASPDYFLKHLQVSQLPTRPLDLTKTAQERFVEKTPLVAAGAIMMAGGDTVNLSELHCAVASLFGYLQVEKGLPLFGHPDFLFNTKNLSNAVAGPIDEDKLKTDVDLLETRKKEMKWRPFEEEANEALTKEDLAPKGPPQQLWPRKIRARRFLAPLRQKRLLNPLSPEERFSLISDEYRQLQSITGASEISRGKRDALLLQEDYIQVAPGKVRDDIRTFFETRGLVVDIDISPFEQGREDSLPCLVINDSGVAAVLLGYAKVDNEAFAFLYYPQTGRSRYETLADRLRRIREAGRQKTGDNSKSQAEDSQERLANMEPERRKRIEATIGRMQSEDEKIIVGEDVLSALPDSLGNGIHLVCCATLRSWKMVHMANIEMGDNWGMSPFMKVRKQ